MSQQMRNEEITFLKRLVTPTCSLSSALRLQPRLNVCNGITVVCGRPASGRRPTIIPAGHLNADRWHASLPAGIGQPLAGALSPFSPASHASSSLFLPLHSPPCKSSNALILLTVDASLFYCPHKYCGVENNEALLSWANVTVELGWQLYVQQKGSKWEGKCRRSKGQG